MWDIREERPADKVTSLLMKWTVCWWSEGPADEVNVLLTKWRAPADKVKGLLMKWTVYWRSEGPCWWSERSVDEVKGPGWWSERSVGVVKGPCWWSVKKLTESTWLCKCACMCLQNCSNCGAVLLRTNCQWCCISSVTWFLLVLVDF